MSPTAPLRAVAFLGGEGKREALGPRVGVCAGHEKRQLTALPSRAVSSLRPQTPADVVAALFAGA